MPLAFVWLNPVTIKLPIADYLGDIIADAGADQCLTTPNEATDVTLDAAASTSIDGKISKAVWHVPGALGCEYVAGTTVTVRLPKGTHDITVEVTDAAGDVARDSLIVSVSGS